MPLRDHFHRANTTRTRWAAVHGGWPMMLVRDLFNLLPPGYIAEPNVQVGSAFELDVSTFETENAFSDLPDQQDLTRVLATPTPTLTVEYPTPDEDVYEVQIYDAEFERELVAMIEIVSPSNKDRPQSRRAFINKMKTLIDHDISVSVIDVVTKHQVSLYAELQLEFGSLVDHLQGHYLEAFTVRNSKRTPQRTTVANIWHYPLTIGEELPTLPILLSADKFIKLPLETSYEETCRLLHIP